MLMTVRSALARLHTRSVYGSLDFFAQLFVLRQKVDEKKLLETLRIDLKKSCYLIGRILFYRLRCLLFVATVGACIFVINIRSAECY